MTTTRICTDEDSALWQAYVETRPACGIYHHFGWKRVLEGAYGLSTYYLVAEDGGAVTGILPLALIRSRVFGSSITSLPYVDFAGIVADSAAARDELVRRSRELARENSMRFVEFRQLEALPGDLSDATHKVLMTLEVGDDESALWSRLSSERRNRVRRATKTGLGFEVGGAEALADFYDVWSRNMRDLGSPAHSIGFFRAVLENFPGHAHLFFVTHEGRRIGAALAMDWAGTLHVPWVSSLRDSFRLYPNNLLYWEAMRFAVARGLGVFDFGRSTVDSGTYEFKARWGARPSTLHWQTLAVDGAAVPSAEAADGFRLAIEIWKRIPVSLTRLIGPSIRKNITA